jgi:hypothetical protein
MHTHVEGLTAQRGFCNLFFSVTQF